MKTRAILVSALVGVSCSGCDILFPPEPDHTEADRQIEALMDEIEKLNKTSQTEEEIGKLEDQLAQALRETSGVDAGGAQYEDAAYRALVRELNECSARLAKCEGTSPEGARPEKAKSTKTSKPSTVPADLENPFD